MLLVHLEARKNFMLWDLNTLQIVSNFDVMGSVSELKTEAGNKRR